ncbi:hypothetical protein E2C01_099360 [Portunus trituberculatus]|uniref:Uncharacterized protein n=1 Tax=Portunus trituberculatus TaxID=210409 RepID=A0A5B7K3N0_PORTR|nr:hypothetical protein [Portunus trituberculatus]
MTYSGPASFNMLEDDLAMSGEEDVWPPLVMEERGNHLPRSFQPRSPLHPAVSFKLPPLPPPGARWMTQTPVGMT